MVVETCAPASGPAGVTIVGHARRSDAAGAALANGVMAHVLDWDDTLLPARLHLSSTLLPALLATGEEQGAHGRDVITAFAVGFEIQARLAEAISPEMPERGWHGTGVVGAIGVAAAVSRLLELGSDRIAQAFGIAGTGAAGLVATFGSMAKALNLGRASSLGIQSAQLAARGFTSHPDLLGVGRFLNMYDDAPRLDEISDGLGTRWAILRNGFKPYPCGVVAHAAIDAVLQLREEAPAGDTLESIRLTVSPETVRLMGNARPRTELEAKFSVAYAVVAAWASGVVVPPSFDDAAVTDPAHQAMLGSVAVRASDAVAQDEAFCELATISGWTGTAHVRHARGTESRPLTDAELQDKFRIACEIGGNERAEDVIAAVGRLDTTRIGDFNVLLAPRSGG
jgi:2-methylcitrate dehydratase PrpD